MRSDDERETTGLGASTAEATLVSGITLGTAITAMAPKPMGIMTMVKSVAESVSELLASLDLKLCTFVT